MWRRSRSALSHYWRYFSTRASSKSSQSLPYPRAAVSISVAGRPDQQQHIQQHSETPFEYLLVQRRNPPGEGTWSLPGGKICLGETVLEAGQRELLEETGIEPSLVEWQTAFAGYSDVMFSNPDDPTKLDFHYVLTQLVAVVKPEVDAAAVAQAGDDAVAISWASANDLQNGPLNTVGYNVIEHLQKVDGLLNGMLR
mgnify:CR=1 FL=1